MNSVFVLVARLKGNTEEKETGTSEIIFRNSGWVVPVEQFSNFFMEDLRRLATIVA